MAGRNGFGSSFDQAQCHLVDRAISKSVLLEAAAPGNVVGIGCFGLALFWIYQGLVRASLRLRWVVLAVLVAVFSVPVWEHPAYDRYWILLGIVVLLFLNPCLWQRSVEKDAR